MNAVIITARAGSRSIPNKNIMEVEGHPLLSYPLAAAGEAELTDRVFVSTNGDKIAEVAREMGAEVIWRPEELWGDGGHGKVIKHATEYVDETVGDLENVVVLLGNTTMVDSILIDQSLELLKDHPEVDSTMSVWEAADDHPIRAMQIDDDGYLTGYFEALSDASTDRKTYPSAYYYDQGPWTFRKECVQSRDGPGTWWWMGERCLPIIRTWTTGRDIHNYFDAQLHEWYHLNRSELLEYEKRIPADECGVE